MAAAEPLSSPSDPRPLPSTSFPQPLEDMRGAGKQDTLKVAGGAWKWGAPWGEGSMRQGAEKRGVAPHGTSAGHKEVGACGSELRLLLRYVM